MGLSPLSRMNEGTVFAAVPLDFSLTEGKNQAHPEVEEGVQASDTV